MAEGGGFGCRDANGPEAYRDRDGGHRAGPDFGMRCHDQAMHRDRGYAGWGGAFGYTREEESAWSSAERGGGWSEERGWASGRPSMTDRYGYLTWPGKTHFLHGQPVADAGMARRSRTRARRWPPIAGPRPVATPVDRAAFRSHCGSRFVDGSHPWRSAMALASVRLGLAALLALGGASVAHAQYDSQYGSQYGSTQYGSQSGSDYGAPDYDAPDYDSVRVCRTARRTTRPSATTSSSGRTTSSSSRSTRTQQYRYAGAARYQAQQGLRRPALRLSTAPARAMKPTAPPMTTSMAPARSTATGATTRKPMTIATASGAYERDFGERPY